MDPSEREFIAFDPIPSSSPARSGMAWLGTDSLSFSGHPKSREENHYLLPPKLDRKRPPVNQNFSLLGALKSAEVLILLTLVI